MVFFIVCCYASLTPLKKYTLVKIYCQAKRWVKWVRKHSTNICRQTTVKSKSHSRLQMFGWCFLILANFHLVIQSNEYIFSREWWGDGKQMTFRRINYRLWEFYLCLFYLLSHLSIISSLTLHSLASLSKEHIPLPPVEF